jgi:hypothetical protein
MCNSKKISFDLVSVINKLKPEDITYNFDVRFYEDRHDLYIEVFNSGETGSGIMDF